MSSKNHMHWTHKSCWDAALKLWKDRVVCCGVVADFGHGNRYELRSPRVIAAGSRPQLWSAGGYYKQIHRHFFVQLPESRICFDNANRHYASAIIRENRSVSADTTWPRTRPPRRALQLHVGRVFVVRPQQHRIETVC